MVRHIVWWTLKDEADGRTAAENAELMLKKSAVLAGLPGVLDCHMTNRIERTSTVAAQAALVSDHRDAKALAAYQIHPAHLEFAGFVKTVASSRNSLDLEL